MCLAVTGRVVAVDGDSGRVVVGGREREVSLVALPGLSVGDYVIVSLGMALERISEQEASEIDAAWDEIAEIEVKQQGSGS